MSAPTSPRAREKSLGPLSLELRAVALTLVLLPLAGLAAAIWLFWSVPLSWVSLGLFVGMYLASGLGITIGFHRLFTHRSFAAGAATRYVLAALGSMAFQGSIMEWVAIHRAHHEHSDEELDPHSPHSHEGGVRGLLGGFWHAHIGWFIRPRWTGLARYVPDLVKDPALVAANTHYPLWVAAGLLIPAAICGAATLSWMGALLGLLWGGLARLVLVHHITWSINSVCHIWGARPFETGDESRNNALFGILAFGEGWHNNHHAFPASARHGLMWWQFDLSYVLIRGMEWIGLAQRIRVPSGARIAERMSSSIETQAPE